MDVTDLRSVKQAAAQIGDGAVDLLINSAGIAGKRTRKLGMSITNPGRRFSTLTPWGRCGSLKPSLITSPSERKLAVTITSGMGSLTGNTSGGSIAYRSSKAAVNMVMRSAAIDFAPRGVACVLINPGWVKTDMGGPGASLTRRKV